MCAVFKKADKLVFVVDSVLGMLCHVNVGDAAYVKKVHDASIFMVEACRLKSCHTHQL
jgi:hypothetical protein